VAQIEKREREQQEAKEAAEQEKLLKVRRQYCSVGVVRRSLLQN
jgi:hypothetical protein